MSLSESIVPPPPPIPDSLRERPLPPTPEPDPRRAAFYVLVHLVPLLAVFTGASWEVWACCAALYVIRVFGITAFYHRYFAHRSFKTSRWFQFVMAVWAMTSLQRGVLWWSATHRAHHRFTDLPWDPHSPAQRGLWFSHGGWLFDRHHKRPDYSRVQDLARYPELVWLDRYYWIPPLALALGVWFALGWSGLLIGFLLSTLLVWHAVYAINSLAHVFGRARFDTGDTSRNNWALALLVLGEGWHNNHHAYPTATRQGFYWWEIDLTYYALLAMRRVGLIWGLREPPAALLERGRAADRARSGAARPTTPRGGEDCQGSGVRVARP